MWGEVNPTKEKRERVTTGGKGKNEIRNEVGKITEIVLDAPTMDSLGKKVQSIS